MASERLHRDATEELVPYGGGGDRAAGQVGVVQLSPTIGGERRSRPLEDTLEESAWTPRGSLAIPDGSKWLSRSLRS
jgi:hypothetical protein